MYAGDMATFSISEARANLPAAVELARTEAVTVEKHGKPAAILISPEYYERLLDALEEADDVRAFDEAMADEGDNIPWEIVKADLGWT